MSLPTIEQPEPGREKELQSVPWNARETWLGVLLFIGVLVGIAVLTVLLPREGPVLSVSMALLEAVLVLPVVIVLGIKRVSWRHLGFRKFSWEAMALSIGALLLVYPVILLHNYLLIKLGIDTQGDSLAELYQMLEAPVPFLIGGGILAPVTEEIFFRGFLFTGLRQRHGWVGAMLISSAVFAAFHLQPVAILPTFLLGCVLAFAYQRSNSIWPGILLHLAINSFALGITVLAFKLGWL